MNYKIEGAIKKNKVSFIVFGVLWLIMAIVLVTSISYSIFKAEVAGDFGVFIETLTETITDPFGTIAKIIDEGATGQYFETLLITTIITSLFFFVGFVKSAPKNQYTDIEHGSSDWSKKGEQYEILSKTKGIILAENNYLPVDKRGNVNVLVVGRFGFSENQLHIQFLMHIKCLVHTYLQILKVSYMTEQQDI